MTALQGAAINSLMSAASNVNLSNVEVVDGVATLLEEEVQTAQGMTLLTKAMVVLNASSGLQATVGRSRSTLRVPAATLEQLKNGSAHLAVSFGVFPDTTNEYKSFEAGSDAVLVAGEVISILITGPDGKIFKGRLPEPIDIELSTKAFHRRNACVFWDEDAGDWSTFGLEKVGVTNQSTQCRTTHLSVFTLILATLTCSQAARIFSQEALLALVSTPWAWQPPALVNWATILVGCWLLRLAYRADQQNQAQMKRLQTWARECHERAGVLPNVAAFLRMLGQCRQLGHHGLRSAKSFICSTVINTKLGVDNAYLDNLHRSIGKTDVHRQAHTEVESFLGSPRYRQFSMLFASSCRWVSILAPSWQLASMDRCLLLLAKLYSTWALSAIFFGSTSVAPDQDPDCEPQEGFWPMLVQSVTVAVIAGVFGALPLGCLVLVQQACRVQVSTARTTFRSFVFAYTFTCWLTTCLFLAVVSSTDAERWVISAVVDVCKSAVMIPFLLASICVLFLVCQDAEIHMSWTQHLKRLSEKATAKVCLQSLDFKKDELLHLGFERVCSVKVKFTGHDRPAVDFEPGLLLEEVNDGQTLLMTAFAEKSDKKDPQLMGTATLKVGSASKLAFKRHGKPLDLSAEVALTVIRESEGPTWHTLPPTSSDISLDEPPLTPREGGVLRSATEPEAPEAPCSLGGCGQNLHESAGLNDSTRHDTPTVQPVPQTPQLHGNTASDENTGQGTVQPLPKLKVPVHMSARTNESPVSVARQDKAESAPDAPALSREFTDASQCPGQSGPVQPVQLSATAQDQEPRVASSLATSEMMVPCPQPASSPRPLGQSPRTRAFIGPKASPRTVQAPRPQAAP